MNIVEYDSKYKDSFIQFNTDWIVDNFGCLEKEDYETFAKIDEELEHGAMIYFAVENDIPLATCMAKPIPYETVQSTFSRECPKDMSGETWEICKLGSDKHREHKGCGSAVFEAAVQWAIDHGAKRLFILSNRKLKTAIHIYEKYGFREIVLDDYEYDRGDIAFERLVSSC